MSEKDITPGDIAVAKDAAKRPSWDVLHNLSLWRSAFKDLGTQFFKGVTPPITEESPAASSGLTSAVKQEKNI
jgi:hypothetical protein